MTREEIKEVVLKELKMVFGHDITDETIRFREDLAAKSLEYFPLISALEDDLDIDIEYHEFQSDAQTIGQAIDLCKKLYDAQHGKEN